MNKKGFTLIELIATITILSIIMMIAIPNVISVLNKNKAQTYVNDARKMITLAKYRFESDANISRPTNNSCVLITLKNLDRTELNKGPENGRYDLEQSFVLITYNLTTREYVYSAQLYEVYSDNHKKGIGLTDYSELTKLEAKNDKIIQNGFRVLSDGVDRGLSDICQSVEEVR